MKPLLPLVALAAMMLPARAVAQHEHTAMHEPTSAAPVSARDSTELRAQIEAVRAATARYRDHANAVRDGYRLFGRESPLMGEHWYRRDLVGQPLDLRRPSTLQYANVGGRKVLVGVAYTVYRRPGEPVPEGFAGVEDHWHTHDVVRLAQAATSDRPFVHWLVERRIRQGKVGPGGGRTLLTMVHAWVWLDNPQGTFAMQQLALPYLRAGLPAAWATADAGAAQGVELLVPDACRDEVGRTDRLASLGRGQARQLTSACEREAAQVRSALARRRDAATVNAAAARAWSGYEAAREHILHADQLARMQRIMGAVMEHEMAGM